MRFYLKKVTLKRIFPIFGVAAKKFIFNFFFNSKFDLFNVIRIRNQFIFGLMKGEKCENVFNLVNKISKLVCRVIENGFKFYRNGTD